MSSQFYKLETLAVDIEKDMKDMVSSFPI